MKQLLLFTMILAGSMVFLTADAQRRGNAPVNINSQPDWGPAGYSYVRYYYLPDADIYYDVSAKDYIYRERGRWVNVRVLPPFMRNINLYNSYKVVINEPAPWMRHNKYKKLYVNGKNRSRQICWRDSRNMRRHEVADYRRNDKSGPFKRDGQYDHPHDDHRGW